MQDLGYTSIFPETMDTVDEIYFRLASFFQDDNPYKMYFEVPTRHGSSKELDQPATWSIPQLYNYFITNPGRVINLPFALAELVWIMSGSDDDWIIKYNKQMAAYTDEYAGMRKFNAAYGYRMREQFSIDQLNDVIDGFKMHMDSRQQLMVFRHPIRDRSNRKTADRACNIALMFLVRNEQLHATRVCRSQDFMWGVPYNFIQFGHIHQFVAESLGLEVGEHNAIAQSLHLYEHHFEDVKKIGIRNWREELDIPLGGWSVPRIVSGIPRASYISDVYLNNPKMLYHLLKLVEDFAYDPWFRKRDIVQNVKDSPFWIEAFTVLLAYNRKNKVDWALETLQEVRHPLFRLMALRYFYNYWRSYREAIDKSAAYTNKELEFIRS